MPWPCALTPDGWHIYPDAARLGKISNNYQLAGWQPINFSTGDGMPWAYLGTLAILLVTQLFTPRALQPTALVVVLTFGFWPVLQQRGLGYWWLIVPWLVASLWRREPEPEAGARATAPTSIAVALAPASGSGSIDPRLKWVAVGLVVLAIVTTPLFRTLIVGPRSLDTIVTTDTPARLAVEMTTDDPGTHLPAFRDIVQAAYPDQRIPGGRPCRPGSGRLSGLGARRRQYPAGHDLFPLGGD